MRAITYMFEIKFTFKTRKNNKQNCYKKTMQQQFQEKCNNTCWLKFPFEMYDGRNALCKLINAAMLLGQQTKRERNTHKQQTIATDKERKKHTQTTDNSNKQTTENATNNQHNNSHHGAEHMSPDVLF